jgi:hypothetical protein
MFANEYKFEIALEFPRCVLLLLNISIVSAQHFIMI